MASTASSLSFIFGVVVFFSFMVFMSVEYAGDQTSIVSGLDPAEFEAPTCEISGWDAIIDAVVCAVDYTGSFISLMSISSEWLLFNSVIIFAVIVGLIWAVVELIRG